METKTVQLTINIANDRRRCAIKFHITNKSKTFELCIVAHNQYDAAMEAFKHFHKNSTLILKTMGNLTKDKKGRLGVASIL